MHTQKAEARRVNLQMWEMGSISRKLDIEQRADARAQRMLR